MTWWDVVKEGIKSTGLSRQDAQFRTRVERKSRGNDVAYIELENSC